MPWTSRYSPRRDRRSSGPAAPDGADRFVATAHVDRSGPGQGARARGPRAEGIGWGLGSDGADVVRLRALLALAGFEANPLALLQRLVPSPGDGRVVDEDVLAAVVGGNEAEALLAVEPLHGAVRHISSMVPGPGGGVATSRSQSDRQRPARTRRQATPPTHVVSCRARMPVDVAPCTSRSASS